MFESLVFSIALSTHIGFEGDFNNVHPRITYKDQDYITGVYYNSESQLSLFFGKEYTIEEFTLETGVVTGYSDFSPAPMIKLNRGIFFIAPAASNGDPGIVTGIEVKF